MAITGIDVNRIHASLSKLNAAYGDLYTALGSTFQNKLINGMSSYWFCQEARDFFDNVISDISTILSESHKTFESVFAAMNDAAKVFSTNNGSFYSAVAFSGLRTYSFSNTIQLKNSNNVAGIDVQNASNISQNALNNISIVSSNALNDAVKAVRDSGFEDNSNAQATALLGSLNDIQNAVKNVLSELSANINRNIKNTAEKYGAIATNVTTSFEGN